VNFNTNICYVGGEYDLFNTSSLPNYGCLSTQYNIYVVFLYYLGNFQRNHYIRYEIVVAEEYAIEYI
jgi:hypothetical protein